MPKSRKSKPRSKNEAKIEIIAVHELPYTKIVKSETIKLASGYEASPSK